MKYYIEILGCQQNEYDAEKLSVNLQSIGFIEVKNPNDAEYIFILACSVRQTAVDRIFGRIRNWSPLHSSSFAGRDEKKIFLTGCVLDSDKKKFEEKGVKYFSSFEELKKLSGTEKQFNNTAIQQYNPTSPKGLRGASNMTAFVPIMSGCNNFCSYCVVPYTRGREKSRPMAEIIAEVKKLISEGKREIALLGQNVNSYKIIPSSVIPDPDRGSTKSKSQLLVDSRFRGNDGSRSDFVIILEELNDLDGDFVISFLSNHPKDMSDDIIEAIAKLPKIKKEVHLPLQSGSDKILKLMNRPYTILQYLSIVENLKFKIQNLKLTTDIIVGFPGETGEDFQETYDLCKKVGFELAYINKYSPRKGTAAFGLGDPILWKEKQRRWQVLDKIINK